MERRIECRSVSVLRRGPDGRPRRILRDVSAVFAGGRPTLVTGDTGAGKSTLLYVLACLLRPTAGEVLVDGEAVSRWVSGHRDLWRRQAGFVFQSDLLLEDLCVLENLLLPLIPRGQPLAQCRRHALEALDRLESRHLEKEEVRTLSGGERQRVSIARALVAQPVFLFADEPTAHQDGEAAERILQYLKAVAAKGAVVVITAHDPRIRDSLTSGHHFHLHRGSLEPAR